jgi:hypothetical protein
VSTSLTVALCGLLLSLVPIVRTARAHWLRRRDRLDAIEHDDFVGYYSRVRLAGEQQAADPETEEIVRLFALKVGAQEPYRGAHRAEDRQFQPA